jgi:cell wall-associated NlpC family hydrolase
VPAAEKRKRSASRSARSYRSSGLLRTAYALRGVPYRWGGSSPWGGFDCSGFTQYVYRVNGMSIPRTTWTQRSGTRWISRRYARPGDLVFFHGRRGVFHVGIYAGGNMIVHSPRPGRSVRTERIWSSAISFGRVR